MGVRVLHIHKSILFGGAENSLLQLIRAQREMGMDPVVVTSRECPFREAVQQENIEVFSNPLDVPSWRFLRSSIRHWRELARIVKAAQPDILHIGVLPWLNDTYLLSVLTGVPTVVHVRGLVHKHQLNFPTVFGLRRAAAVICVSEFVNQSLLCLLPDAKTTVIYNGLDPSSFTPSRDPAGVRMELGFDKETFLVGLFANFIERLKKHDTLVRAAARLKGRAGIGFVMVGGVGPDPLYHSDVVELAKTLDVENRIRFVGFQKDVASYVNAMDAVVCCSEGEGFGRTFLEAMACAKPLIGTDSGACPELVQHGETGFLYRLDDDVDLAHRILELVSHPDDAARMGAAGLERLRNTFSLRRHAEAIAGLYNDVLKCRRRRSPRSSRGGLRRELHRIRRGCVGPWRENIDN